MHKSFADFSLTTWVWRQVLSLYAKSPFLSSLICVIFQRSKAFRKIFPDYQNTDLSQLSLVSIHRTCNSLENLKSKTDFKFSIIYQCFIGIRLLRFINAVQKLARMPIFELRVFHLKNSIVILYTAILGGGDKDAGQFTISAYLIIVN